MTSGVSPGEGEEKVALEDARDQVRKVCERLALLHYAFTRTLVDELGEEKGRRTAMNAIKLYSKMIGERVRDHVRTQDLEPSAENYRDDLPAYGMHDRVEEVHVDGERRTRVWGCVMGKVWRELEAGDLGRIYCYVDPAKLMAYNSQLKQVHYRAVPDGDDCCEMAVKPATEADRTAFAARDTDLSRLDR